MSKVFFDVGVSVDGFIAGANRGPNNPLGDGGVGIHRWAFETAYFLERLGLSGGSASPDDQLVKQVFERAGAYVMGRRMFDEGELGWPENPPFRAPVFVLTHSAREPWHRNGGTTFYFVSDGVESALEQAMAAASGHDVRVCGGAQTIRQYIDAGVVDEFTIHVGAVILGAGLRLMEQLSPAKFKFEQRHVGHSALATHINYRVVRK